MKKIVLSLSMFVSVCIFGQTPITITSQDVPTVGLQVLNVKNLSNLSSVTVGSAIANESFDFSWFPNDNQDSVFYISPNSTPYSADFSAASMSILTLPDTNYIFLNTSASLIEVVGRTMGMQGVPIQALTVTDPLKQLSLPANYQDNFIDIAEFKTKTIPFNFGIPSEFLAALGVGFADTAWIDSVRTTVTVSRNSIIDAWGTLNTPDGSFNVLRQTISDTTDLLTEAFVVAVVAGFEVPFGFVTVPSDAFGVPSKDTVKTYTYYTNATTAHPSMVAEAKENGQGNITSANYSKIYNPAGIIETSNNIISELFPNPSKDVVNIKANDKIEILNVYAEDGRLIYNRMINSENYSLNISTFKTGVYFVEINTAKGREVKRINKI